MAGKKQSESVSSISVDTPIADVSDAIVGLIQLAIVTDTSANSMRAMKSLIVQINSAVQNIGKVNVNSQGIESVRKLLVDIVKMGSSAHESMDKINEYLKMVNKTVNSFNNLTKNSGRLVTSEDLERIKRISDQFDKWAASTAAAKSNLEAISMTAHGGGAIRKANTETTATTPPRKRATKTTTTETVVEDTVVAPTKKTTKTAKVVKTPAPKTTKKPPQAMGVLQIFAGSDDTNDDLITGGAETTSEGGVAPATPRRLIGFGNRKRKGNKGARNFTELKEQLGVRSSKQLRDWLDEEGISVGRGQAILMPDDVYARLQAKASASKTKSTSVRDLRRVRTDDEVIDQAELRAKDEDSFKRSRSRVEDIEKARIEAYAEDKRRDRRLKRDERRRVRPGEEVRAAEVKAREEDRKRTEKEAKEQEQRERKAEAEALKQEREQNSRVRSGEELDAAHVAAKDADAKREERRQRRQAREDRQREREENARVRPGEEMDHVQALAIEENDRRTDRQRRADEAQARRDEVARRRSEREQNARVRPGDEMDHAQALAIEEDRRRQERRERGWRGNLNRETGVYRPESPLGRQFDVAGMRMIAYGALGGMMYGGISKAYGMIENIQQVEDKMVELQRVLNPVTTDFNELKKVMFDIGDETGKTFTEAGDAMAVFARQGKSAFESAQLAKEALVISNISELDSNKAAEVLTSTLAQFNMTAGQAVDVADKLNSVSNKNAVSFGNLSDATVQMGSTFASQGGNIDELLGTVTALSKSTQLSGSIMGRALRQVFIRMNSDKFGSLMNDIGIRQTDQRGAPISNFQVLTQLSGQWKNLSAQKQFEIANVAGGGRFTSYFMGMMSNWDAATKAYKDSIDSNGSAMRENEVYMDSYTAKIAKAKNAWAELASRVGDAGFLDFLKSLAEMSKSVGVGLAPAAAGMIGNPIGRTLTGIGVGIPLLANLASQSGWAGSMLAKSKLFTPEKIDEMMQMGMAKQLSNLFRAAVYKKEANLAFGAEVGSATIEAIGEFTEARGGLPSLYENFTLWLRNINPVGLAFTAAIALLATTIGLVVISMREHAKKIKEGVVASGHMSVSAKILDDTFSQYVNAIDTGNEDLHGYRAKLIENYVQLQKDAEKAKYVANAAGDTYINDAISNTGYSVENGMLKFKYVDKNGNERSYSQEEFEALSPEDRATVAKQIRQRTAEASLRMDSMGVELSSATAHKEYSGVRTYLTSQAYNYNFGHLRSVIDSARTRLEGNAPSIEAIEEEKQVLEEYKRAVQNQDTPRGSRTEREKIRELAVIEQALGENEKRRQEAQTSINKKAIEYAKSGLNENDIINLLGRTEQSKQSIKDALKQAKDEIEAGRAITDFFVDIESIKEEMKKITNEFKKQIAFLEKEKALVETLNSLWSKNSSRVLSSQSKFLEREVSITQSKLQKDKKLYEKEVEALNSIVGSGGTIDNPTADSNIAIQTRYIKKLESEYDRMDQKQKESPEGQELQKRIEKNRGILQEMMDRYDEIKEHADSYADDVFASETKILNIRKQQIDVLDAQIEKNLQLAGASNLLNKALDDVSATNQKLVEGMMELYLSMAKIKDSTSIYHANFNPLSSNFGKQDDIQLEYMRQWMDYYQKQQDWFRQGLANQSVARQELQAKYQSIGPQANNAWNSSYQRAQQWISWLGPNLSPYVLNGASNQYGDIAKTFLYKAGQNGVGGLLTAGEGSALNLDQASVDKLNQAITALNGLATEPFVGYVSQVAGAMEDLTTSTQQYAYKFEQFHRLYLQSLLNYTMMESIVSTRKAYRDVQTNIAQGEVNSRISQIAAYRNAEIQAGIGTRPWMNGYVGRFGIAESSIGKDVEQANRSYEEALGVVQKLLVARDDITKMAASMAAEGYHFDTSWAMKMLDQSLQEYYNLLNQTSKKLEDNIKRQLFVSYAVEVEKVFTGITTAMQDLNRSGKIGQAMQGIFMQGIPYGSMNPNMLKSAFVSKGTDDAISKLVDLYSSVYNKLEELKARGNINLDTKVSAANIFSGGQHALDPNPEHQLILVMESMPALRQHVESTVKEMGGLVSIAKIFEITLQAIGERLEQLKMAKYFADVQDKFQQLIVTINGSFEELRKKLAINEQMRGLTDQMQQMAGISLLNSEYISTMADKYSEAQEVAKTLGETIMQLRSGGYDLDNAIQRLTDSKLFSTAFIDEISKMRNSGQLADALTEMWARAAAEASRRSTDVLMENTKKNLMEGAIDIFFNSGGGDRFASQMGDVYKKAYEQLWKGAYNNADAPMRDRLRRILEGGSGGSITEGYSGTQKSLLETLMNYRDRARLESNIDRMTSAVINAPSGIGMNGVGSTRMPTYLEVMRASGRRLNIDDEEPFDRVTNAITDGFDALLQETKLQTQVMQGYADFPTLPLGASINPVEGMTSTPSEVQLVNEMSKLSGAVDKYFPPLTEQIKMLNERLTGLLVGQGTGGYTIYPRLNQTQVSPPNKETQRLGVK